MNFRIISVPAIFLCFVISGCGIGGHWMNGDPSAGKNIKPYLHYWEKPEMTAEDRRQDSVICGAANTDYVMGFGQNRIKAAQRPRETDNETDTRLFQEWKRCMIQKNYRWTGS